MSVLSFDDISAVSEPDKRSEAEERWVSFQPYLLSKGYRLRPRYQPGWIPSWKDTDVDPTDYEDSLDSMPLRVLDAIRIQDGSQVVIKLFDPWEGEPEPALLQYFSTPPLKDDPSNRVVPCLDSFPIPGVDSGLFVVMPLLGRYENIPFYNLAEVHDLLQQLFGGLLFMHRNNVAHCDIASQNIMADIRPLYDEPFHPFYRTFSIDAKRRIYPRYTRSQKNIRYYYIGLRYAKWFRDPTLPQLIDGNRVPARVPEQTRNLLYDPFPADVYQLGLLLQGDLISTNEDLSFLLPLAMKMTERDPSARPSIGEAKSAMNTAFMGLSRWKYMWPIIPKDVPFKNRCLRVLVGVAMEVQLWFKRILQLLFFWRS